MVVVKIVGFSKQAAKKCPSCGQAIDGEVETGGFGDEPPEDSPVHWSAERRKQEEQKRRRPKPDPEGGWAQRTRQLESPAQQPARSDSWLRDL